MYFDLFRYFLILIVPGIIAARFFSLVAGCRFGGATALANSLIFALLIFITMITGIYYFYDDVTTVTQLIEAFNCLSFTRKFALLSIFIGLIYAGIAGAIRRWFFWWRRCRS